MKKEKSVLDNISNELIDKYKMKSLDDVFNILDDLKSNIVQAMLDGEIENHLDSDENKSNRKNGYSSINKKVKTNKGVITVNMPRDRTGTFEPIIVGKRQRVIRSEQLDEVVIAMYAKGMNQRDISELVKKAYGIDVSVGFINNIVSKVSEEVKKWRNKPLKKFYPFMYVDCLYVNIKEDLVSDKYPVYVIIGIDLQGKKEVVGVWIGDKNSEGTYFWREIFEEIKARGVEDILYVSLDGLSGLKEAINDIYPNTNIQRCIVHLTRNLYGICPRKEAKEIMRDFKKIYTSNTLEQARLELQNFIEKYKKKTAIVKKVIEYMKYIEPLFEVPKEIRKIIYTTNPIESANSALRKVTRGKGSFPSKESVMKVLYLRVVDLEKKWSKGTANWNIVFEQLINLYEKRITKYLSI